jgi:N-formylglutamate amidohydrolase
LDSAFIIQRPVTQTCPVVFASPHSGRAYSPDFLAQTVLAEQLLRSSEDAFVDLLIQDAPKLGAPLLLAQVPRAYVDLNRAPDEFDPAVIEGVRIGGQNPRIASGLGVIPRVVAGGRAIYRGKLTQEQAQARISQFWQPYHGALRQIMNDTVRQFGQVVLLDMHSMPSEAAIVQHSPKQSCDIILGDRHGASASPEITAMVEESFRQAGLRVVRNTPFAGAYIAQHYGRPFLRRHVVQIEISRGLYMDEKNIQPLADFATLQAAISQAMAQITAHFGHSLPLAAE